MGFCTFSRQPARLGTRRAPAESRRPSLAGPGGWAAGEVGDAVSRSAWPHRLGPGELGRTQRRSVHPALPGPLQLRRRPRRGLLRAGACGRASGTQRLHARPVSRGVGRAGDGRAGSRGGCRRQSCVCGCCCCGRGSKAARSGGPSWLCGLRAARRARRRWGR